MAFKLRPIAALLIGITVSPLTLALDIKPSSVTVGKAAEIQLSVENDTTLGKVQQIALQPAGPVLLQKIPLIPGSYSNYALEIKGPEYNVSQNMDGQSYTTAILSREHADHVFANDVVLRIENSTELATYRPKQNNKEAQGRIKTSAPLHDIAIVGNYAVTASDTQGVTVVDISDITKPRWIGSHQKLGRIIRVIAADDKALALSDANIIYQIDLKNPSEPTVVNAYRNQGQIQDIAYFDQTVFALTQNEIEFIDFSATAPQISNQGLDFGQGVNFGGERRVFIADDMAYVADWFSGMHIYDTSNPNLPMLLSSFHTPGSPKGIVVRDHIAYVADDDHGLQIIDVNNPRAPKQLSHIQTQGLGYTPKLVGDLLYLASHRGGFQIIDIKDPSLPALLSEFDTPGKAWSIEIKDNIAYVADDDSGLLIFNVKDPKQPSMIGQFSPGGAAEEVVIQGNTAYVAFFEDGLYILDITNPTQPSIISHTSLPGNTRGLELIGDRLYVASWLAGVHILDVSDTAAPVVLGNYDTRGATWGLKVIDNYLYAMDWWGGIAVLDISDASKPIQIGGYHERGRVNHIATQGNYAFVAHGDNGLQIFDIKNPLNPTWMTGVNFLGNAQEVVVEGDYAYLAMGDGGLAIANVSNPYQARWQSQLQLEGDIVDLAIHQGKAYLIDSHEQLLTFDLKNLAQPQQLATYPIAARDIAVINDQLAVATASGIELYKTDPSLELVHALEVKGGIDKITFSADRLYAAQGHTLFSYTMVNDKLTATLSHQFDEAIRSLENTANGLLVGTKYQMLQINTTANKIQTTVEYPLLSNADAIHLNKGVAYLSGGQTITAVQLLPELPLSETLTFTVPENTAVGTYYVSAVFENGTQTQIKNKLKVQMPKFSKPKMSMEEFKKLMEEKKNSDIFTTHEK